MSALEPGLYKATVRGISGESIVLVGNMNATFSLTPDGDVRRCYVFTDARPLIVLDMMGMNPTPILTGFLREQGYDWLAVQIEAQTKPAKIEEPKQGERVEANLLGFHSWNQYLRFGTLAEARWVRLKDGNVYAWDQLTNPEVVTT